MGADGWEHAGVLGELRIPWDDGVLSRSGVQELDGPVAGELLGSLGEGWTGHEQPRGVGGTGEARAKANPCEWAVQVVLLELDEALL